MRLFRILIILAVRAVGLFALYQIPAIQTLFEPVEKKEDPLAFLRDLPEPQPRPEKEASPGQGRRDSGTPARSPGAASESEQPAPQNQVPNEEVGKVLIQILKARSLVEGISISVTDEEVQVFGEVDSRQELNEIVEVINKARETRRVNVESVTIGGE